MLKNKRGFTLMEILVVVTIIAILTAIAVPSYIYAVQQGREDACTANVHILNTQVERYRLAFGLNISLEDQSLVEFLQGIGYLVGQDIHCPLGDHEYILEPKNGSDARQLVSCTHPVIP